MERRAGRGVGGWGWGEGGAEGEKKKKSNPVSSSHKSLVSSGESNCTEADFFLFFISNKRFYALVNLVDVICT